MEEMARKWDASNRKQRLEMLEHFLSVPSVHRELMGEGSMLFFSRSVLAPHCWSLCAAGDPRRPPHDARPSHSLPQGQIRLPAKKHSSLMERVDTAEWRIWRQKIVHTREKCISHREFTEPSS